MADESEKRTHNPALTYARRSVRAADGGPDNPRLPEALGARALYLDALWGLFDCGSLHTELQHTILKAGVDLALVHSLWQAHAATEGAIAAPTGRAALLPDVPLCDQEDQASRQRGDRPHSEHRKTHGMDST